MYHNPLFEDVFEVKNIEAIPQDTNHSSEVRIRRPDCNSEIQRFTFTAFGKHL